MMGDLLTRLQDADMLSDLDVHFACFMERLAHTDDRSLCLAAALVSRHTRQGHICLDLAHVEGTQLLEGEDGHDPVICPKLADWQERLKKTSVVGRPGEYKPLILDDKARLYLHRYWDYQERLANLILRRVGQDEEGVDMPVLQEGLSRLFGEDPASQTGETDWSKVAAFTSLVKRFCVISGGPGTGKTTTVSKILALALEQPGQSRPRIALCAPTGKAAARLQEAVRRSKEGLHCKDAIKARIPEEASTIHRLLGTISRSPYFRHNAQNPLPVDYLIVDEASMVDLALMSKLVQALPEEAHLILLGDKDQLASVEAGAVLGDICDRGHVHPFSSPFGNGLKRAAGLIVDGLPEGEEESAMADAIVHLVKNFRFAPESGISQVSRGVNAGDADGVVGPFIEGAYDEITWRRLPSPNGLPQAVREMVVKEFGDYAKIGDVREVFGLQDRFRILCALSRGPYGARALNLLVERILRHESLIEPEGAWYPGRPILITSNDYNLHLFNGDVGIVLPDPESGDGLRVYFYREEGQVRKFHPLRLPEHETAYAMTVHKSQGSEFDRVLFVLPDTDSPVLTRELIYTAITRAKRAVEIWGREPIFRAAVSRRTERSSGLRDALWT
jgi:exodeoxyribonuclease V alpha subunit